MTKFKHFWSCGNITQVQSHKTSIAPLKKNKIKKRKWQNTFFISLKMFFGVELSKMNRIMTNTRSKLAERVIFTVREVGRLLCGRVLRRQRSVGTGFPLSSPHQLAHIAAEALRLLLVGKVQTHLTCLQCTHKHTNKERVKMRYNAHFPRFLAKQRAANSLCLIATIGDRPTYLMVCWRPSHCAHQLRCLLHK